MNTKERLKAAYEVCLMAERSAVTLPNQEVLDAIRAAKYQLSTRIQDIWPDQRRSQVKNAVEQLLKARTAARKALSRNPMYDDVQASCDRALGFLVIW